MDFDHNPAFLADECALNQCYNFKRTGNIEHTFRDIPQMYEEGAAWGVRHMFLASWNRTGFDSFYPEYYPDMELGSAMEFRRGLEYVREHGGFSTLYINARIFDVKSDFHKTVGEKMAVRNEKGEPYRETYGPEHFTVNCPSDTLWRDYLLDTAEFCVKAYGCDGIYLDQLASAEPFACYCAEHSHENIGEFNNGYVYVLRELLRRLRKHNPNAYIMTENCGDIYGSYTWGNLTWNGAEYDEYYNVFKYTFPEFVQVNMVNLPRYAPCRYIGQRAVDGHYHPHASAGRRISYLWQEDGAVPQGAAAAAQGSALFGRRLAGACAGLLLCGLLAACGRARNGAGGQ